MDELHPRERDKIDAMKLTNARAQVAYLPVHSGDGYSYGGGAMVVIGRCAVLVGEGDTSTALAKEIARRWNATSTVKK